MILGEDAIVITKDEARKLLGLVWDGKEYKSGPHKYVEKLIKLDVWDVVDGLRMAVKDKED